MGPEGPKKVSASLAPFTSSKNQAWHHSSDVAGKGELRLPEVWPAQSAPSPFMARLDLSALMLIQKLGGENGYNKNSAPKVMLNWRNKGMCGSLSCWCLQLALVLGTSLPFLPSLMWNFSVPRCHCKVKTRLDPPASPSGRAEQRVTCTAHVAGLHPVLLQGSDCLQPDPRTG